MKEIILKIVELPMHQVLLMKEYDEEEQTDSFSITFEINGVRCKQIYGYDSEEERDKFFNEVKEETLQKMLDEALKMFS